EVYRNIAVRIDPTDRRIGIDPDVCVVSPAPRERRALTSVATFEHGAPLLSIEVVSTSHPNKDYREAPARHAATGVTELWVLDPILAGPRTHGGPFLIQRWARDEAGTLVRTHAGPGPFRSSVLDAFMVMVEGVPRLCDDSAGLGPWLTRDEASAHAARAAEQVARAAEQAARAGEQVARAAERAAIDREHAALAREEAALRALAEIQRARG
ncbi:MAG: Uma2 family endonuclease, partial [Myxococcales bacterium]|nr:Uma2 family endonuclease [Myxococcales bacterium]